MFRCRLSRTLGEMKLSIPAVHKNYVQSAHQMVARTPSILRNLIMMALCFLFAGTAQAEVILQTSGSSIVTLQLGDKIGQSFTPATSGSITKVGFSGNGGTYRLAIHEGYGQTGAQIYWDYSVELYTTATGSVHLLTLDTPVPVTAGQTYTITLLNADVIYSPRGIISSASDVYPGGTGMVFSNSTGIPSDRGSDFVFRVDIEDVTAPVLSAVTNVPSPTADSTPSYTFSSNEAGTISYGGGCSAATTSAVSGNNTITFNSLADGTYSNCTVRVSDAAGNASAALKVNTFTVDTTAPTLTELTPVPTMTNDNTPSYTFRSTEAGVIGYGGSCSAIIGAASAGQTTVIFNILPDGHYSNCTLNVTDGLGNRSANLAVSPFTVDTVAPGAPSGLLAVNENSSNGTVVGLVSGGGADVTYSLTSNAGGRFAIDAGGTVTVANGVLLDHESAPSQNITVRARDLAGNTTDSVLAVTINNVNEAPVISGSPATSVEGYTAYSFTPNAIDPEGDAITFSITNKPVWASFDSTTGTLSGEPDNSYTGTTSGIVISASDGSLSASLGAFNLTVSENLDIDGDGMPNDWEIANGFDPFDPNDAGGDADGDGLTNLEEYEAGTNPLEDDNPPVVTAPDDLITASTALFTEVDLGEATAVDDKDGEITPTADIQFFAPGMHIVTWSATDSAGNTGTATQTVMVEPRASFGQTQTTAEGASVTVSVMLNGRAASYPVTIPYTVSGTAATDGSDHDLLDGEIVIASGTEGSVSFNVVDDGAGEGSETMVLTMGATNNAVIGENAEITINIVEGNVAPRQVLAAKQNGLQTRLVGIGEGPVMISSDVIDPNAGDTHDYDWSASDNVLVDLDGNSETFTFDPYGLTPGVYTVRLAVSDGTDISTASLTLNVLMVLPKLVDYLDRDGDGVDDASDGYGDSNNDGIADYLDAVNAVNVMSGQANNSTSHLVETETGLQLSLGEVALHSGLGQAVVSQAKLQDYTGVVEDDAFLYRDGFHDFTVNGLAEAGQSVKVVLPQSIAIPAQATYRKVVDGRWKSFVENGRNRVASASGAEGFCPSPGDSAYTPGLAAGNWCVQLTVEDGGPNDADGKANRTVVDPGGVGVSTIEEEPAEVLNSGGGSLSPLWWVVLFGCTMLRGGLLSRKPRVMQQRIAREAITALRIA